VRAAGCGNYFGRRTLVNRITIQGKTADECSDEIRFAVGQILEQYAIELDSSGMCPGIMTAGAIVIVGLAGAVADWTRTHEAIVNTVKDGSGVAGFTGANCPRAEEVRRFILKVNMDILSDLRK
jgi:hypothetical protein